MKCLTAALFLMILTVLAACTKSTQGNSSAPVPITLSYATTESGQLELLNPLTGYSYMKITTGTKTVGIAPGTTVKAVWTPASGDTNTPAFWIDSRASSNMAAGANMYSFKVSGTANIQMHLSAPENTVQILAPSHGIISWTLNSTHGQVSVGDPTTSFVVRASDLFSVSWDANGSAYFISVWDLASATNTDRTKKDISSTALILTQDTTISAEITSRPLPHYRMKIQSPAHGELSFTNPDSLSAISLPSNRMRYGVAYEVLTDNDPLTAASFSIIYNDHSSGFGASSYNYLGISAPLSITAGSPNYDLSLPIVSSWNMLLKNDGADDTLDFEYTDPAASCSAVAQIFINFQCFNGVNYCATLGQQFNGTACY